MGSKRRFGNDPVQAYFEALSNTLYHGTLWQFYLYFLGHIHPVMSPQWPAAIVYHLWFLVDLFVFSFVTLPVCRYLKLASGHEFFKFLTRCCEMPGVLPVLCLTRRTLV